MSRRIIFWLVLLGVLAVVAETGSWLFFEAFGKERFKYHEKVIEEKFLSSVLDLSDEYTKGKQYDPRLGWDELEGKAADADSFITGGRANPYKSGVTRISAYGDSFTYCQDVDDNQTWEYYLSESTGGRVLNYGVRGFGTDQALLKLKAHLEAGYQTKIVILGVLSENIARVMNANSKFYWVVGSYNGFKPILVEENEKYVWKDKYLENLDTLGGRRRGIEIIRKYDYWYGLNKSRPNISFPYSMSVLSTARYFMFKVKRWPDLWENEYAVGVMRAIVDNFQSLSKQYGFTPVLLFIPERFDLIRKAKGKKSTYSNFLNKLRDDYKGDNLITVDILEEEFDINKFNRKPLAGHASAYGNKVIAEAIYKKLRQ